MWDNMLLLNTKRVRNFKESFCRVKYGQRGMLFHYKTNVMFFKRVGRSGDVFSRVEWITFLVAETYLIVYIMC